MPSMVKILIAQVTAMVKTIIMLFCREVINHIHENPQGSSSEEGSYSKFRAVFIIMVEELKVGAAIENCLQADVSQDVSDELELPKLGHGLCYSPCFLVYFNAGVAVTVVVVKFQGLKVRAVASHSFEGFPRTTSNAPPLGAHPLRVAQDVDYPDPLQNRRRDVPRQLQPVARRRFLGIGKPKR
ncbi:hypothetical protein CDL15_Pgr011414 [Punica granatum]|uniref:Uncharacterized protein n=1 Tax=Punica granatum TaxID=22663 RepID=A0A218WEM9_PUNGR|nr:hypothetical protein CDL15_Pgr011414 [Punica granatum]